MSLPPDLVAALESGDRPRLQAAFDAAYLQQWDRAVQVEAELEEFDRQLAEVGWSREWLLEGRHQRGGTPSPTPGQRSHGSSGFPEEVGTAQAAEILGVSKDTVLAYREKGLLPFRDLAPPGRTRPVYVFPLDAVVKMRTTYQTEQPVSGVKAEPPRRRMKGQRRYKHLDLDG